MTARTQLTTEIATTPERVIIDLLFHFTILCEYQLLALQSDVRGFVERMSHATTALDGKITGQGNTLLALVATLKERAQSGRGLEPAELAEHASALESAAGLLASVQPDIYTLIECLSFEDIQSQRLDHLARSSNRLNNGIIERLRAGIERESAETTRAFAVELARSTRSLYTMPEERDVFDQVFIAFFGDKAG